MTALRTAAIAAAALAIFTGAAVATPSVSVTVQGGGNYPSDGPGSIGNQIGTSDSAGQPLTAGSSVSYSVGNTGSGTDANGTYGSMSYYASATGSTAGLHAYGSSTAFSLAATSGFPHADSNTFAAASFASTVQLYDPTLAMGAPVGASLILSLDWFPTISGTSGLTNVRSIVFAEVKLDTLDLTTTGDTFGNVAPTSFASTDGTFVNGGTYNVFAQLQVLTQSSVFGFSTDSVSASAISDAGNTLHLYVSGSSTLTAIGEDGVNYAASEPASLAILGTAIAGLIARRRRRI